MMSSRLFFRVATACFIAAAAPANAQIFWQPPDFSGAPLNGYEEGMGVPVPGATRIEQQAVIAWNTRSALNIAALQCGFDPMLRTLPNYNSILVDHRVELNNAFKTISNYFRRNNKTAQAAQKALDIYGTRTYSGFSTVRAQLGFCSAAARVGRIALFTPKRGFTAMSETHLRELRNSLVPQGEHQFRFHPIPNRLVKFPNFDERCWKNNRYDTRCGIYY